MTEEFKQLIVEKKIPNGISKKYQNKTKKIMLIEYQINMNNLKMYK